MRILGLLPLLGLAACKSELLNPSGDIAVQQRDLLINSTLLMLLIIIPVMILTVVFAWRYRASNKNARYEPNWDHSTQLELVIWAAPLLIIICLGALTWLGTHLLDPYRPVSRIAKDKPLTETTEALQIDVVALDWKWLFIYPQYGVAVVNELALPTDRPVNMNITSSSVMNSLYIPAFAGQVYAMPGMVTQLHGVMNRNGDVEGFSANYSGSGFSGMHFTAHGVNSADFEQWLAQVKSNSDELTRAAYLQLAVPSEREPVRYYATVSSDLWDAIVNRCVETGKMCQDEMMALDARIDAEGGLGLSSAYGLAALRQDEYAYRSAGGPSKTYVTGICTRDDADATQSVSALIEPVDQTPLLGAGLTPAWSSQRTATLQSSVL